MNPGGIMGDVKIPEDVPMITMWRGKPVEDLSRDELIDALNYCAGELALWQSPKRIHAYAVGSATMLRRGERI